MRYLFLALAIILSPVSASAEGRNGLTVGVGTLGVEGIYTRNLNSWFDLVLGFSSLNYEDTFSEYDGTSFAASPQLKRRGSVCSFPTCFSEHGSRHGYGQPRNWY